VIQVRGLPTTLRGRLVAAYAAGVAVVVGLGLVAGYLVLASLLRSAVEEELTARLGDLTAAVQAGDPMLVERDPYAQLVSADTVLVRSPATPTTSLATPADVRAADGTTLVVRRPAPGLSADALLAVRPVGGDRYLAVGASLAAVGAAQRRVLVVLLVLGPVLVTGLTLLVRGIVGSSLRPIGAITARAGQLSAATAEERLPQPAGDDEVATLARTLNGMLDRIEESSQRERAFIDDAAHELRTPVAILRGELELGLTDPDPAAAKRALGAALGEADRLTALANDLLVLARARTDSLALDRAPTDLTAAVRDAGRRLAPLHRIVLEVTGDEVVADVDPTRVQQIVTNLVANAAQAGAAHVRIDIRAGGRSVLLTVDDDGPGFPAALLPVRFDRFSRPANPRGATARTRQGGAGLGLAIAAALVHAHRGTIAAGNDSPLGGARIRVAL
jgi:signal transduction histidine kinase